MTRSAQTDHERWAGSAKRKYGETLQFWLDLIFEQEGCCAISGVPMFFDSRHGTPVAGGNSQHPLYAVVDHRSPGAGHDGYQIVCNDLNDLKGALPFDCFDDLQTGSAWRRLIELWRQQAALDPEDREAFRRIRRDGG